MKTGLLVILAGAALALGQAPLANHGASLPVAVPPSVKQLVSVQAVMLPYTVNRELFSKHIADNYAVVVVNVGNRSPDAALIMQGIYLDYSKWALSGNVDRPGEFGNLEDHSSGTLSGQVSSVEYRIVRSELEERDPKTVRNWVLRSLQFAGSVAGGATFAYGAISNIPKYISMVSGVGIPGFEKLWPDSLITKLNRISDFGYRANRIVPRESSDVMIAFFPIERFLTPKLKRIFIRQPALFFNTGLALVDPNPEMTAILERVSGKTLAELTRQIPAMIACAAEQKPEACDQSRALREMVKATSLNSIEVVIDASLMLELSTVPPVVDTLAFEDHAAPATYWTVPGSDKGIVVTGRFLDGVRVTVEPAGAGIDWVSADAASSTSGRLVGKLKFSKPVPAGQTLSVKLVKDSKDGHTLMSLPVPYTVAYLPAKPAASEITSQVTGHQLTLTGRNLTNAPLRILLSRTKPDQAPPVLFSGLAVNGDSRVTFDLKPLAIGCYDAILLTPDVLPLNGQVKIAPSPTIVKATRTDNSVKLEGNELVALAEDCTLEQVKIAVLDDKGAASATNPANVSVVDPKGATVTFEFAFPDESAKWRVRATAGSVTSKPVPVE